jgi:hypothetical protein
MHIKQAIYIEATPAKATDTARAWMLGELQGMEGEIIDGMSADGSPSISSVLEQDGIRMTTTATIAPHESGSKVTLELRTEGISRRDKLRNVSLLPGRKLVRQQVQASLLEMKANTEQKRMDPGNPTS